MAALLSGLLVPLYDVKAAAPASAPPPEPSAEAMFVSAQALYDGGKFQEALESFTAVVDKTQSPNARLYVARCLRELGRRPEAFVEMRATLQAATERAKTEERYAETRDAAAAELARLAPLVGQLTVAVGEGAPPDLAIKVNGRVVVVTALDQSVPVEPGDVSIEATAKDYAPFTRTVAIEAGGSKTLAVTLQRAGSSDWPTQPLFFSGIAVAGLGVAGFVTFAVAGVMANAKYDELTTACGGAPCDASYADDVEAGRTLDLVANIGVGIGAVGLAGGLALMLAAQPWAGGLTASAGPDHAFVGYSGRF
ncbi:MAG: tetratricopeptide repeat protein [Polyangiaceae bacterium]